LDGFAIHLHRDACRRKLQAFAVFASTQLSDTTPALHRRPHSLI
jgi:hypothetical protein